MIFNYKTSKPHKNNFMRIMDEYRLWDVMFWLGVIGLAITCVVLLSL